SGGRRVEARRSSPSASARPASTPAMRRPSGWPSTIRRPRSSRRRPRASRRRCTAGGSGRRAKDREMERRRFRDRTDAGRRLAQRLLEYVGRDDVVVLALPRGGVPVAYEVAKVLSAPLGIFLVRKLGVPGHEELAMGA